MSSVHFISLLFLVTQDLLSCVYMKTSFDLTVALGDSLTLNCSYNCSTGFVRGCWRKASDNSGCLGKYSKSSFCTTSLHLSNVSTEDLKNYTCYTEDTEDPQLPRKIELTVLLQLEAQTSAPNCTTSLPAKPEDSGRGEFVGIKVLAAVTVAVAMVLSALAAYLCLHQNRQRWSGKGESVESRSGSPLPSSAVLSPLKGSLSAQSERVTLRIPTPDNESDTEVPYADIMITVRGVSTPELTQVGYLTPGDQNEWWGDESRCHLQASRSADRLHVHMPKEVSRKMSTNSEYAVITYA
ncbi:uncharacterized protein LOC113124794 [Mastacembelus armatus]|uniref:uncharacterized protein LOC113124794 n=1 Tax=Mastacembelus armatus TaxID=205130 RepID=UPI000E459613|nr:uncharacterized protein LOC113124794 [Mastacembelus armatus]